MHFTLKRTRSNGYRCGCCSHSWGEDSERFDTLEEAVAEMHLGPFTGDGEITEAEITDENGDTVAEGRASWSSGYGRGGGYLFTRWAGHTPEGQFEIAMDRDGHTIDRKWSDISTELKRERDLKELEAARGKLKDAQAKVAECEANVRAAERQFP
jgi:hypothetical protein